MATRVRHSDRSVLRKPERLPNGMLRAEVFPTRTGVFEYTNADGSIRRELRLPDEVFAQASIDSMRMVPLTLGHPPEWVTSANAAKYARGSVGDTVAPDGEFVRATICITHADAVAAIDAGTDQLSCGYDADLEMTPGEYEGVHFDCIQRNIRHNHLSLVDVGRAGAECAVPHVDAAGMSGGRLIQRVQRMDNGASVETINIGGVDFQVPAQVAQAFRAMLAKLGEKEAAAADAAKTALDAAKAEVTAATTKADGLAKQVEAEKARADIATEKLATEKARADAAESPAKIQERVAARVALVTAAASVMGADWKADGKDDLSIKREVVTKVHPTAKLDGKSADYVEARFDSAIDQFGTTSVAEVRRDANDGAQGAASLSIDDALEARAKKRDAMSKAPIGAQRSA